MIDVVMYVNYIIVEGLVTSYFYVRKFRCVAVVFFFFGYSLWSLNLYTNNYNYVRDIVFQPRH